MDVRIRSADYEGLAVSMEALVPLFDRMESEFSASQFVDPDVQEKFMYIRSRLNNIAYIQRRIQAGLLPVPGVDGIKMLRTELRQSTYRMVMEDELAVGIIDEQPAHSVTRRLIVLSAFRLVAGLTRTFTSRIYLSGDFGRHAGLKLAAMYGVTKIG